MSDVVELIIADHQRFEALLRDLRNVNSDREPLRTQMAEILIAHAEAEEEEVYPSLRRKRAAPADEVEHGREEHAEINDALLNLLEVSDVRSEDYDEKLEALATAVNHHNNEEEQTLINDARVNLQADQRLTMGEAFTRARQRWLDSGCGDLATVRRITHQTDQRL